MIPASSPIYRLLPQKTWLDKPQRLASESHQVYRLLTQRGDFVWREPQNLRQDFTTEALYQTRVGALAGFHPWLWWDFQGHFLAQFLADYSPLHRGAVPPGLVQKLASVLYQLQKLPPFSRRLNFPEALYQARSGLLHPEDQVWIEKWQRLEVTFLWVNGHGDLTSGNILIGKQNQSIRLIDYEYMAQVPLGWDWAHLIWSLKDDRCILQALDKPTRICTERLLPFVDYLNQLWCTAY